ncbi:hypothetical protein BKA70DRAFT_1234685 [Coprinopsis sp. MPI-PUGE-AT-0042]|nr:hypothetical protein BKA70DRAFT_1234685 [Coprinopsis sp. MPI-PUGE-AT-0042]
MVKASASHLTASQRKYNREKSAKSRNKYGILLVSFDVVEYLCGAGTGMPTMQDGILCTMRKRRGTCAAQEAYSEQEAIQRFRSKAGKPETRRKEAATHIKHSIANVKTQESILESLCGGDPKSWVDSVCRNFILRQRTEPGVAKEIIKAHISKFRRVLNVVTREQDALAQHPTATEQQLAYVHRVASRTQEIVGWLEEIEKEPSVASKYRTKAFGFFQ